MTSRQPQIASVLVRLPRHHDLQAAVLCVQFYEDMQPHEVTEAFLWSRLDPVVSHLSDPEKVQLQQCLRLARRAHDGQFRKSGEPFITHPVEVTRILAELHAEVVRTGSLPPCYKDWM